MDYLIHVEFAYLFLYNSFVFVQIVSGNYYYYLFYVRKALNWLKMFTHTQNVY